MKERLDSLKEEQEDLKKQIYDLVNVWMSLEKCSAEPDVALGLALGAMTEAAANYTATYRFHNRLSNEWSQLCCDTASKVFYNAHYIHIQELLQQFGNEELPPIN